MRKGGGGYGSVHRLEGIFLKYKGLKSRNILNELNAFIGC